MNRPPGFDLMTWRKGGSSGQNPHDPSTIDPIVEETIKWLKGQGMEKIGAVGYCFVGEAASARRTHSDGIYRALNTWYDT